MRVTNGKVAASRARLHDGHKAPVPCRPRTRAGQFTIRQNRAAQTPLSPVHGRSGAARGGEAAWIRSAAEPGGVMTLLYFKLAVAGILGGCVMIAAGLDLHWQGAVAILELRGVVRGELDWIVMKALE